MFLCLLSTDGSAVTDVERTRHAARIRALAKASAVESERIESVDAGEFVAFAAPALVPMRPLYARRHGLVGVGNVRLDHPETVRRWSNDAAPKASSLDLVLAAIDARGTSCLRDILGDFSLVTWEPRSRTLTAARDAFGVKTLFIGHRGRLLVLSSHLELVHDSETLDEEFVADFLLAGDPGPERTIWADSRAVPQGSIVRSHHGTLTSERFWTPYDFEPAAKDGGCEQVDAFRALFREAVRVRIDSDGPIWAELSGGLDSSSIVCMAQTLHNEGTVSNGIAGTITIVDELGDGDERRYSDLTLRQFGLTNAVVANPWPWQHDQHGAPRTDEPRAHYPFFARDRHLCDTVRQHGARVLLDGTGSDHYLYGNRFFISDLVAAGRVTEAITEVARWSIKTKRSFWTTLARDAALPLLPVRVQRPFLEMWHQLPDWIEPSFATRLAMSNRLPTARAAVAPRGRRFARDIANGVQELTRWLPRGAFEEGLELRYPFLYRPLVEFGLQLSPTSRAQPLAPKWILREAMRGILPEPVRTRSGKGAIDARIIWALGQERTRIAGLLADPILSQLGMISADRLRRAAQQAERGELPGIVMLLAAVSLETWLSVRAGCWKAEHHQSITRTGIEHQLQFA